MKLTAEKETSVKSIERKSNHSQQNGDKGRGGVGGGGVSREHLSRTLKVYNFRSFYVVIFLENSTACITKLFFFFFSLLGLFTAHKSLLLMPTSMCSSV